MAQDAFVLDQKLSPEQLELSKLIQNLLIVLSDKEKYIISSRFALAKQEKRTLEEIGQHFGLTRERVRQIEQVALKKLERSARNTNVRILTEFAKVFLEKEGGVMTDTNFKTKLLAILPNVSEAELQDLHLALNLDPEIQFSSNTLKLHPYWHLANVQPKDIQKVIERGHKILSQTKQLVPISKLCTKINEGLKSNYKAHEIEHILQIDKACKKVGDSIGLYSWRHIHPRTLHDKIHFVLSHEKKPLHFEKIAQHIRQHNFDSKNVNTQAVHNELIRNTDFVLIGRGIYALKEWGYKAGTVSDVIERILSDGIPRSREEVTKAVLAERQVKTITIQLNLKNQERFARIGRDKYTLSKFA